MADDGLVPPRVEAVVDLGAIAHNVGVLAEHVAPSAVWAVVKADAYGHGAVPVAQAVLAAGAEGLCVALVEEGVMLRSSGITAAILVLSPQSVHDLASAVHARLTLTVHDTRQVDELAEIARDLGVKDVAVHIKIDTGMHRVGAAPQTAGDLVDAVRRRAPWLRWDGIFSHLACADDPTHHLTPRQIAAFEVVLSQWDADEMSGVRRHMANSAGALAWPSAIGDFVRSGIALYGIEPGPGVAHLCHGFRPALTLRSRVSMVKTVPAGSGVSYGWHTVVDRDTVVATVPLGYADGVPRRLSFTGGEVLIGGKRRPILGVVTMDQLMVDCGHDMVDYGDEVILLGRQHHEEIRVEEWAERLGTIPYEIVCGISARVPRRWIGEGQ
jgi:alanine racemase